MTNFQCFITCLFYIFISYVYCRSYDESPKQYDPKGRLIQLEYAMQAINTGDPIIALKCDDGIIIATAKEKSSSSKLLNTGRMVKTKSKKVMFIDHHICAASTGLYMDSLPLHDLFLKLANNYRKIFGENIPLEYLCEKIAENMHSLTISGDTRPMGLGMIISGYDRSLGYQLYSVLPDGSYYSWIGICLGRKSTSVKTTLSEILKALKNSNDTEVSSEQVYYPKIEKSLTILKSAVLQKYFPVKVDSISKSSDSQNVYKTSNDEEESEKNNQLWDVEIIIGQKSDNEERLIWNTISLETIDDKSTSTKEEITAI